MAIVHLPTIDEVRPVNEGVELSILNRGVLGHYPDSAAPGDVGNFAVAGHRTTYGRPLWGIAELSPGDPIVVETPTAYYVYRLSELRIVQPDQSEVVAPVPGRLGEQPSERWMVMTACHPKFSASQRIVALSMLDHAQPRSAGAPAALTGG
jgi:sortase A